MTEKEKMEAGYLYMPSGDIVTNRYRIQDAVFAYNKIPPSHYEERAQAIKKILGKTGEKIDILPPFRCDCGYHIEVGENFFANYNLTIMDVCPITIGHDVFFGPNISLLTPMHPLDYKERNAQVDDRGQVYNLEYGKPIRIGDNCWFGGNVTVIDGITIGNGCVIGAGSVVTHDIPDHSLAAGNPCRVIREI